MRSTRPLRPAHPPISRRTRASAIAVGALVVVTTLTGLTAASASAVMRSAASDSLFAAALTAVPSPAATITTESLRDVTAEARTTLAEARTALAGAQSVTSDISASGLDVGVADTTVDTGALTEQIDHLSALDVLPVFFLPAVSNRAAAETEDVVTR